MPPEVPMSDKQAPLPPARPPRYKLAVITWLGVYPILTATLALLGPMMETWPLPLRTLLVTLLLVPLLVYVVFPFLNRAFRGWLFG
jgi:antibiotic biosynthesis monooxygenase (ABM) superfamily enzyme